MGKLHYIIVLIVVLIIATLTYKLSTSFEQAEDTADPNLRHDPDYFINNFNATMYDKSGAASYLITAQYLEHFPDNDTIEAKQLMVQYFDVTRQVWQVSSSNAIGYKNIETLDMSGNVKVERQTPNPDKNMVLETDVLRIDFKAKLASTDSKVKITGKNSTINATGMDISLDKGTMILKSHARGRYVPN